MKGGYSRKILTEHGGQGGTEGKEVVSEKRLKGGEMTMGIIWGVTNQGIFKRSKNRGIPPWEYKTAREGEKPGKKSHL